MNEDRIVQRCRDGDREAQRELYALTADRAYRVLLRLTCNPEDTFDLVQETYLRVFAKIHQFDGRCGIMTWVYRIAVNEGLQFLRQRKRHDQAVREGTSVGASDSGAATVDTRLDIEEALTQLSASDRALIVLRHFEELTYAEMEEILDRPPGTIASGLNRARHGLRELLEGAPLEKD